MSKPVLYLFNGKVASFGNAFLGFTPPDIYTVTLDTVTHGSISASPMSGAEGTTIELSSTPDTGYQLGSYSVDGSAIVGSSFSMPAHNLVVGATFSAIEYTVSVGTSLNGSVTASAQSATYGTTITLTGTPDSGYELDYFTVNGVAIVGNSFTMPAENVTVSAVFVEQSPTFDEVTIGTQTWMSKNLSIDDGGEGIYTRTVNYGQGDVVETYYTWAAAVRVAASIQGWHLPSKTEFDDLITYNIGSEAGTRLKSTYGWTSGNGTDEFGFTGLPAGSRSSSGSFSNFGSRAYFWTATEYISSRSYVRYLSTNESMPSTDYSKGYGLSVRLIKDS